VVLVVLPALAALPAALALAQAPAPRTAPPAHAGTRAAAPAAAPIPAPVDAIGVVRSATPGRSVAILSSGGKTRVVAIGETAFGARLVAIGADAVTLDIDGQRVEKRLTSGSVPATAGTSLPRPAAPVPTASVGGEDPATPHREMDRQQVQARLGSEMNRILSDTAIVPVMDEGRVTGVQVTRIAEGSLLTDAGLRAGDVITRVNDTDIDGMATLIGLWPRLQNATELRATVLRNGQPVSLVVGLR
jgi:general secretion pathway protein C